jgi:hypothetical protein
MQDISPRAAGVKLRMYTAQCRLRAPPGAGGQAHQPPEGRGRHDDTKAIRSSRRARPRPRLRPGTGRRSPALRDNRIPPPVHPLEGVARQNLKITDVRVTLMSYELPPEKQWMVARAVTWKTDAVLVEVFTDKGIVGIGESSPYGGPPQMKKMIEEWIRPTLLGKNPFDVEQLTPGWSAQRGRPGAATWAGIDMALWDIIGKATNTPVYRLLATDAPPERRIRVYASGGVSYAWYKRPEDLIDEAVRHKEAGYTAFKFRIGDRVAQ